MEIIPPDLTSKSSESHKQELLAWREVTRLSKSKQGIVVALSLPEDDTNLIREKVFSVNIFYFNNIQVIYML